MTDNQPYRETGQTDVSASYQTARSRTTEPCLVAYCRGGHEPGGLHDIPACLRSCGPLVPGQGRAHDPACPNAGWRK